MTEKKLSLGACVRYDGMGSFSVRIGALSLTGKKYKIQAAQKNTELYRRNSRKGGLNEKRKQKFRKRRMNGQKQHNPVRCCSDLK